VILRPTPSAPCFATSPRISCCTRARASARPDHPALSGERSEPAVSSRARRAVRDRVHGRGAAGRDGGAEKDGRTSRSRSCRSRPPASDADSQYFGDGLAEELINALARVPGLRIAARTSSFRFRGSDLDVREIGAGSASRRCSKAASARREPAAHHRAADRTSPTAITPGRPATTAT